MTILMIIDSVLLIIFLVIEYILYRVVKKNKEGKISLSNNMLQEIFNIMGSNNSSDEKILNLNNTLLNIYKPKYASIVVFDGNKNSIKASNIEEIFKKNIEKISNDNMFKLNIKNNVAKYITTSDQNTLLYNSAIERKIKSALLMPIYNNNSYLGYVLLEDEKANKFDNISKIEISTLKKNIGLFLENTNYQSTIEIAGNIDKQTGFLNNVYLYSNAINTINEYDESTVILVFLKNLNDINEECNRNIGNALLAKFANITNEIVPKKAICIRYSGRKFLILIPGANAQKSHVILERLLTRYKSEYEIFDNEKVTLNTQILLHTIKKQNNIEYEIQKMSSSFDRITDVNVIKII